MIKFDSFHYIYPPRPKNSVKDTEIDFWDNKTLLCQPKLNGSNCVAFMNGTDCYLYNRHGQLLTNTSIDKQEILSIYSGDGWMVLNGEYMNKSKQDENREVFNHKLVIFDILVNNSEYLIGSTFQERINILTNLFGDNESEKSYLYSITPNIYLTKTFYSGFNALFNDFIKVDMLEGIVCKRLSAKLEIGTTEENNTKSMIKFRKKTKNYKF